jgi:hypothetical protein
MAPITGTLRDSKLVGTSVTNRPTCADDTFGLFGKDRLDGRNSDHRLSGSPDDQMAGTLGDDLLFGQDRDDLLFGANNDNELLSASNLLHGVSDHA